MDRSDDARRGPEANLVDLNNKGQFAGTVRPVWGISHAVIYR
ncbi:hypothetical protein ACFQX7_00060 [Luedemannella flava]